MDKTMPKTILITGSGFGKGTAIGMARNGHDIIATVHVASQVTPLRGEAKELGLKNFRVERLYLTDLYDIASAQTFDIDVLWSNAGMGEAGPVFRGLLAEHGIVLPRGAWRLRPDVVAVLDDPASELTTLAAELFRGQLDQLRALEVRIATLDHRIVQLCRASETCRRLAALPGVGPIIATALVASVGDARQFRCGRDLAAWIGLVPRQHSSGGRPKLLGISAGGNHYLRKQLIQGARSVLPHLGTKDDRRSRWLRGVLDRRGSNRAVVALANKTARIAPPAAPPLAAAQSDRPPCGRWVLMARGEVYRAA